jgi:hypothetical protein
VESGHRAWSLILTITLILSSWNSWLTAFAQNAMNAIPRNRLALSSAHVWSEELNARRALFLVRQIARIMQFITIVLGTVLAYPHRRPVQNQATNLESPPIQLRSGRTLSCERRINVPLHLRYSSAELCSYSRFSSSCTRPQRRSPVAWRCHRSTQELATRT